MTPEQIIRLESLRLADPKLSSPDVSMWLARAAELESYIAGAGQPSKEVPSKPSMSAEPSDRAIPRKGPAHK